MSCSLEKFSNKNFFIWSLAVFIGIKVAPMSRTKRVSRFDKVKDQSVFFRKP